MRRRIAFALASLAVMAVVCGFAFLPGDGFPAARSERLAGTPVTLRLQDDVKTADVRAIRTGIRLAHRYMRRHLGRTVREPVEAQVAGSAGCDLLRVSDGIPVGQAERGRLCIDTGSLGWQWLLLKDRTAAAAIAAHEYVHDLQAELGCLPGGSSERPRWLVEGMANEVAWRAMAAGGRTTAAASERRVADGGAFDQNLQPLHRYEREQGRDAEYALWQAATHALLAEAARRGTAPAGGVTALVRYCRAVGRGAGWRVAFRASFGLAPQRFYEEFDRARITAMATRRIILPLATATGF